MISTVPSPSAESSTISARQACFCGVLRSRTSASRRVRSEAESSKLMPVRMRQTRMSTPAAESLTGFKCRVLSTSPRAAASVLLLVGRGGRQLRLEVRELTRIEAHARGPMRIGFGSRPALIQAYMVELLIA
jgi:hypothetical protein